MFLKLSSGKGLIIQAMGNLSFKGGFKYFMVQDQKLIGFFFNLWQHVPPHYLGPSEYTLIWEH